MSTKIEVSIEFGNPVPEVFGGAEALIADLKHFYGFRIVDIQPNFFV